MPTICQSYVRKSATGITPAAPWRISEVEVLPGYRLSVTFNDGTSGIVDMSHLVSAPDAGIYSELRDEELFARVTLELGTLCWPNGADLDPEWLHEEIGKKGKWVPGKE